MPSSSNNPTTPEPSTDPMAKQKRNAVVAHSATLNDARSDKQVYALLRTAFRNALRQEVGSVRAAAAWMRTTASTVQRWTSGERPVNAAMVLRSRRLSAPFVQNLRLLVAVRNGRRE